MKSNSVLKQLLIEEVRGYIATILASGKSVDDILGMLDVDERTLGRWKNGEVIPETGHYLTLRNLAGVGGQVAS